MAARCRSLGWCVPWVVRGQHQQESCRADGCDLRTLTWSRRAPAKSQGPCPCDDRIYPPVEGGNNKVKEW